VDVMARHAASGALLIVEVKSVVPDLQAMLMSLDRKARLGREIAAGLGWQAGAAGRVLVIAESRTSRRRVATHEALFAAALPARTVAVRRWLQAPDPTSPIRGLWFLSSGPRPAARHRIPGQRTEATDRARSAGVGKPALAGSRQHQTDFG